MKRTVGFVVLAAAIYGCGDGDSPNREPASEIVAGVEPIAWLARRIAGEHLHVAALVRPGMDPHTYEPTPKQIVRLRQARMMLTVGLPFEGILADKLRADKADLTVVDLTAGLDLLGAAEHAHGREHEHGDHDDAEIDPHVWMSPVMAAQMAERIRDAFAAADPDHAEAYRRNTDRLLGDLRQLDDELREALAPVRGRTLLVFHPAFGYFARQYGLVQEAVEVGGKSPGPRHIKQLIDLARARQVRVIFVQPQFSRQAAESIASQIGGAVVPVDPLAADYLRNMRRLAETVTEALASPDGDGSQG